MSCGDNPPTTDELAALDGVTGSEDLGDGSFRVHFDRRPDITERVIDRSVRSGWGLKEIRLERRSLERYSPASRRGKDEAPSPGPSVPPSAGAVSRSHVYLLTRQLTHFQ